jgi:hypothetical protein
VSIDISITDLTRLSKQEITELIQNASKDEISEFVFRIAQTPALSWENRMILKMIDASPFTFWASDKSYKVRLWAGKCEEVYNRKMLGKEFHEFISRMERRNAMRDSVLIIDATSDTIAQKILDYKNYYTKDLGGTSSFTEVGLITNSMQLYDDDSCEYLYAEIGLPIDIEKALCQHQERILEFKEELLGFEQECDELLIRNNIKKQEAQKLIDDSIHLPLKRRQELIAICRNLASSFTKSLRDAKSNKALYLDEYISELETLLLQKYEELNDAITENKPVELLNARNAISREELIELIDSKKRFFEGSFDKIIITVLGESTNCQQLESLKESRLLELKAKQAEISRRFSFAKQDISEKSALLLPNIKNIVTEIVDDATKYLAERNQNGKKK